MERPGGRGARADWGKRPARETGGEAGTPGEKGAARRREHDPPALR